MKKRLANKTLMLPIDLYQEKVRIIVGSNEYIERTFNKLPVSVFFTMDFSSGNVNGQCILKEGYYSVIIIREECENVYVTLAHEILHASINILTSIDIKISSDSEEVLAYLHTYLFSMAIKKLNL